MNTPLVDTYGRTINYLRVSVTDRCNLRCAYCTQEDMTFIPHPKILRYEEILRIIRIARLSGVGKVRLTGGEPFARKDFTDFVVRVAKENPGMDIRITTNGTMVEPHLAKLKSHGIDRLNISLDTLDAATFKKITGVDKFSHTFSTIVSAVNMGFTVKINAVALKGISDVEMGAFVSLAKNLPVQLRFIELMPMSRCQPYGKEMFVSCDEILAEAGKHARLIPVERHSETAGPARVFDIHGGLGSFGVISAVSQHFCNTCNRLRITPGGHLRTCLFSDKEYNLRNMLRNPKVSDEAIKRLFSNANRNKPLGYMLLKSHERDASVCDTRMSAIGG